MAYLLIVPLCFYIGLAVAVMARQPRGPSNVMLALYVLSAAASTAGYIVLGTTTNRALAEAVTVGVVIVTSWSYLLFLPYILIGLYFEAELRAYWPPLLAFSVAGIVLADAAILLIMNATSEPLVYRVETGFVPRQVLGEAEPLWSAGAAMLLSSQVPLYVIAALGLRHRRLSLWGGAVPFSLVAIASMLFPVLAPLAGAEWLVTVAALGYLPPVLLLAGLVLRSVRQIPLESLIESSLEGDSEAAIVIDSQQRVLWYNRQAMRWLGRPRPPGRLTAPQHVFDLLRETPLIVPVRHMIEMATTTGEAQVEVDGEEHVLQLQLQPLEHVRYVPGAHLLTLRDITASRVRRNLEERRRELLALSAISADIASSLDVNQVLTRALQQIAAMTPMDGAAVYLLAEDQPDRLVRAKHLLLTQTPTEPPEILPLPPDSAPAIALRTRQAIFVADAAQDPNGSGMRALQLGAGALVPLVARDRVIGLLMVAYLAPHPFESVEMALLESVSRQLAVATENAHLLARERHQRRVAEALREVASVLSKPLDEALRVLLARLATVLDYHRAQLWLCAGPARLRLEAQIDPAANDPPATPATPVILDQHPHLQALFDTRAPLLIADTAADERWPQGEAPYRSWLGIPLITRDHVLGCLSIAHRQPGYFSESDQRLAAIFAAQAVIAVENARLFQAEQRRRVHAETLQQASYDLVTSITLEDALRAVLQHLSQICPFDRAHIALIDPDNGTWSSPVAYPSDQTLSQETARLMEDFPLIRQMIESRRPILLADTEQDARWQVADIAPQTIRSWIGAPLVVRDRVIGILNIDCYTPGALTEEHLQFAQLFAHQLGAAVENSRLLAQTRQQNHALGALNTVLAASTQALTHDNLLSISLQRVLEALNLSGGAIHQRDPDAHKLRLRVAAGLPAPVMERLREVPLGDELPAIDLPDGQTYAFTSVPLVSHGDEIGLLSVRQTQADLCDLLSKIGQQLGVVMDNATLFEEVNRRLEQLRLVNEVGRYATAILSVHNLVEGVAQRLFESLDYQTVGLIQVQGDQLAINAFFTRNETALQDELAARFITPDSVTALAVRSGAPVRRNQSGGMGPSGDPATGGNTCSLAVPLLLADEVIGALVVERAGRDSMTQADLDMLEPLAAQLAISVSNARLFETIRQQAAELEIRVEERTTVIRQQAERTEAILRSVADAVIVFDLNEQVLMTNPVAKALLDEYDPEYNLRARIRTLVRALLAPDGSGGDASSEIIELGPVTLQAKAARVVEGQRMLGTVVVLRDFSRQRELDRLKDQFVSTVSHELRTPLANLKLYLSLLNQGRPERRASYLAVMGREIERLARLINDLLQISRLQSQRRDERPITRERIDLVDLIDTVVEDNRAWADNKQIDLRHEQQVASLPPMMGDRDQIVRALHNLTSNALSYTPEGGCVIVRSYVESIEHETPEWVIIEVIDNGIGIPDNELSMVFDRFYRGSNVDPGIPGTGLGLAIIKDIVELHGGSIEMESEEGRGSTFRLVLPALRSS